MTKRSVCFRCYCSVLSRGLAQAEQVIGFHRVAIGPDYGVSVGGVPQAQHHCVCETNWSWLCAEAVALQGFRMCSLMVDLR